MYALHLPGEERPASRKTRVTPLFDTLSEQGGVYTTANGWERVKFFSLDGREEEPGQRKQRLTHQRHVERVQPPAQCRLETATSQAHRT